MRLVKTKIWPQIGYAPHDAQRRIHSSRARHRVVSAGRRMGKSQLGGHELTPEVLKTHLLREQLKAASIRREFWIVGPEYTDSEKEFRVFWDDLKRLEIPLDKPGSYNNPESGEMVVSCWDGLFKCYAKSAKYPSTLVGEGLSGVIMSEAAKLKHSVWIKYIRPTLADFHGWSLHTSTPEGKNWFYDLYQRGQNPDSKLWESWRLPAWENDIVYPGGELDEEILDLRSELTEESFNQEIAAMFTEYAGRVFKLWDEEIHVRDLAYDPSLPLYLAVDYGWSNPFVALLVQVNVWDDVFVIGEYRNSQKDINEIAADLLTWRGGLATKAAMLYPDPAGPGDTNILMNTLKIPSNTDTGGELKYRLQYIRKGLKLMPEHASDELKEPKLFIDRSCNGLPLGDGGLIREMDDYRYPEAKRDTDKERPENPLSKDDHGPEALGRFYRGHYGPADEERKGNHVRVSRAMVS